MKQRVKITTVDPSARRIEGVLKDGAIIQIALYEIPNQFRWPIVGEYWTVIRENNFWYLGSAHELDEDFPVEAMEPGDTKIGATRIFNKTGQRLLARGDDISITELDTTGLSSEDIDGLFPQAPLDGTVISDPVNHSLLVRQTGQWYSTTPTLIP